MVVWSRLYAPIQLLYIFEYLVRVGTDILDGNSVDVEVEADTGLALQAFV